MILFTRSNPHIILGTYNDVSILFVGRIYEIIRQIDNWRIYN